jgi:hypothetical protein
LKELKLQVSNIVKQLIFFILTLSSFASFAQQGLQFELTEQDSIQMKLQRELEYKQMISGLSGFLMDDIELPDFNYQEEFSNRYKISFNFSPTANYSFSGFSSGMSNYFPSPFYRNAQVFSSAAYQIGDKVTFGGFSYGANSIFSAPHPNQQMNNFDNYGSTLFMEYKVSKNFKIETRVNVQKGGRHPGF